MAVAHRPWHRSLIKTGARILLGGSRAHEQDWFPGLRILRGGSGPGEVRYRGRTVAALYDSGLLVGRSPESIYLVGSGPSIRNCDLTRIESGSAILLNGAISLIGEQIETPLAIAVEDERFIWRHFDLLQRQVAAGTICLFSVAVLRAICEHDRGWLADRRIILIDDIRKPYGGRRRTVEDIRTFDFVMLDAAATAGLSFAPDRGVFQGGSVAVSALQFILHCMPRRIGFFGIDISNADQPRFYENGREMAVSGIARAETRILAHFILAKGVAAERHIALMNFSPTSALLKCGFGYDSRFAVDGGTGLSSVH